MSFFAKLPKQKPLVSNQHITVQSEKKEEVALEIKEVEEVVVKTNTVAENLKRLSERQTKKVK